MDLYKLRFVQVLLVSALGCCAAQDPLHAEVGGNVTFPTATLEGEEFITTTWTVNGDNVITAAPRGETVAEKYKGRIALNKTTGSLTISKLKVTDSGDYTLVRVTMMGHPVTEEITLKVLVPVTEVTVKSNVSAPVEFNDTVSLTCTATGSEVKYQWLSGATVITAGDRTRLSSDNSILTIPGVLRSDKGPFICSVSNALMEKRSSPLTLNISYGPENVAVTVTPVKPIYSTGTNLTLSCSAQSSPAAVLGWAFNGATLNKEGQTLMLSNILENQRGNYTCVASNTVTKRYKASEIIRINVLEPISGTQITGPTTPLVAGNSSVNMSCQAVSGTISSIEWFKNGQPLSPSNTLTISADKSSVSITPVESSDSGEYQCKLTNPVNSNTGSYKLAVNYGPDDVKVQGDEAVEVGDKVTLTCSAKSIPPATFSWTFNGTLKEVTSGQYVIDKAVYLNSGNYECTAKNAVTGLSRSIVHRLSVKEEGTLDEPLSGGAIAGIVIGVLVAVAIIAGVVYYLRRNRKIESPY